MALFWVWLLVALNAALLFVLRQNLKPHWLTVILVFALCAQLILALYLTRLWRRNMSREHRRELVSGWSSLGVALIFIPNAALNFSLGNKWLGWLFVLVTLPNLISFVLSLRSARRASL